MGCLSDCEDVVEYKINKYLVDKWAMCWYVLIPPIFMNKCYDIHASFCFVLFTLYPVVDWCIYSYYWHCFSESTLADIAKFDWISSTNHEYDSCNRFNNIHTEGYDLDTEYVLDLYRLMVWYRKALGNSWHKLWYISDIVICYTHPL